MYANKLLDAYKEAKNYLQDKQIAHDLGISKQKLSNIRSGIRQLTDTEAIFLAENANIDPHEALIFLAADKAKDYKAQQIWNDITAKLSRQGFRGLALGMAGILAFNNPKLQCAL
ncbi:antirepressor, partial [Photobacterium ganghwense]